jgi:hypothetical protein
LLETRLFNLRSDLSGAAGALLAARLRTHASTVKADGFIIGRNLNPTPFPARFEWFYMLGRPPESGTGTGAAPAAALDALLTPLCRSMVGAEFLASLPPGFAAGSGVGVRHTVMFDFNAGATPEARRRNLEAIRGMGRLPMVGGYRVEANPAFGSDPTQMEWQVIGDFASLADYKAYAEAPVHLAIRDDFRANTARVAFIDVEVSAG